MTYQMLVIFVILITVPGEPQTQSVVIVATVGWTVFGVLLLLVVVYCVR